MTEQDPFFRYPPPQLPEEPPVLPLGSPGEGGESELGGAHGPISSFRGRKNLACHHLGRWSQEPAPSQPVTPSPKGIAPHLLLGLSVGECPHNGRTHSQATFTHPQSQPCPLMLLPCPPITQPQAHSPQLHTAHPKQAPSSPRNPSVSLLLGLLILAYPFLKSRFNLDHILPTIGESFPLSPPLPRTA